MSVTRKKIHQLYEQEFLRTLESQATNKLGKYKIQSQKNLKLGDVVAVKTNLVKPYHYPMGLVYKLEYNNLQEVNAVTVRKENGELLRRHPSDVILLIQSDFNNMNDHSVPENGPVHSKTERPNRRAKSSCGERL